MKDKTEQKSFSTFTVHLGEVKGESKRGTFEEGKTLSKLETNRKRISLKLVFQIQTHWHRLRPHIHRANFALFLLTIGNILSLSMDDRRRRKRKLVEKVERIPVLRRGNEA